MTNTTEEVKMSSVNSTNWKEFAFTLHENQYKYLTLFHQFHVLYCTLMILSILTDLFFCKITYRIGTENCCEKIEEVC